MGDRIKQALTRRFTVKRGLGEQIVEVPPSTRLLLAVKFSIGAVLCLTILEIAYMAFLGAWSSEIFSAITGLIGIVSGVFITSQN